MSRRPVNGKYVFSSIVRNTSDGRRKDTHTRLFRRGTEKSGKRVGGRDGACLTGVSIRVIYIYIYI